MSSIQDRRVWIGGGSVAALLIAAIGWFFFVSPELSSASDQHNQAASVRQENAALQVKLKVLQDKSARVGEYTAALRRALEALPSDSGLPQFTRQLTAQAKANGVTLSSVVVGGISSVTTATAPATAATAPATATTPDTSTTSAPVPDPAVATAPATAAGGLYSVQVTIQSTGTLAHEVAFLHVVQVAGPRRALITSTQLAPGAGAKVRSIDAATTVTTQLTVFSAPQSPDQVAQLNKLLSGKIGN
jgi:hypothetical protein